MQIVMMTYQCIMGDLTSDPQRLYNVVDLIDAVIFIAFHVHVHIHVPILN